MKNIKRKFIIIQSIILIFILITSVYASSTGEHIPVRLGLKLKHGEGTVESNYHIYVNQAGDSTNPIVVFKVDLPDGNFQYALNKTIYCLKAGPGFGLDNWTKPEAGYPTEEPNYTEQFDLKQALLNQTIIETPYNQYILEIGSDNYKKLMWVFDNMYAPEATDAQIIRKNLLYKAGLYTPAFGSTPEKITTLTDADIDVIQQCVVWYFTNSTEADYHSENINLSLGDALDGTFTKLSDSDPARATDAQKLYSYFINSAEANYQNYSVSLDGNQNTSTRPPIELANTDVAVEKIGDKYMVGPYRIDKYLDFYYDYQLNLTSNGNPVSSVIKVKNQEGNYVAPNQTGDMLLHDLEGQDFYFEINNIEDLANLKLHISGNYYQSKVFYLSTNKDKDDLDFEQPLAVIEKFETPFEFEKIFNYQKFDLALRKWVTQALITEKGETTVINSGHTAEDEPEEVFKIELNRKKLNTLTVKFKYSIKVTNEGEIAGYATEIKDHIPQGLKFVAGDNPLWTQLDENTIVTDQLKDHLLQPGESTTVEVILTWINGENNLGVHTNVAEISKDDNESNTPDIDSTPDNNKEEEDDQDEAPTIITVITGELPTYIGLALIVTAMLTSGIILIRKYVV